MRLTAKEFNYAIQDLHSQYDRIAKIERALDGETVLSTVFDALYRLFEVVTCYDRNDTMIDECEEVLVSYIWMHDWGRGNVEECFVEHNGVKLYYRNIPELYATLRTLGDEYGANW